MLRNIIGACALAILLAGCASSHTQSGVKLDRANVEKIQKGKTTMTEVESLFGTPFSTSLMGDGRKMALYMFIQSDAQAQVDPAVLIPIVGGFVANTKATGTYRQQTLQIIYASDGVVQDYVFNDNTTNSMTNAGVINGVETHSTTAPTPEPAAAH
jgi:outer membrane protein assembly factor BamE (lipoprotein component of BamABCDE complex)